MSQSNHSVGNVSAPAFRAAMNASLQALASLNSGPTAPSTTYANMLWYDTGANILKMRSEADDAWINVGTLDQSANTFQANYTPPFTPVQQGGGIGQLTNKVYIGWSGSGLKVTVDSTDLGAVVFGAGYSDAQARAAQAGHSVGGIGSYANLLAVSNVPTQDTLGEGSVVAGSSLRYTGSNPSSIGSAPAGTWRCMGRTRTVQGGGGREPITYTYYGTVFLRIS